MNSAVYEQSGFDVAKQNVLLRTVYNKMMVGLFISGAIAYIAANSIAMRQMLFGNGITIWVLFFIELGLVFAISGAVKLMTSSTAYMLFIAFSAINGLTLSSIFLMYTASSISATFFITGLTFGATSYYGYVTKTDLTSWGKYLFMGLIGIIIASVVNMFLHSSGINWMISYLGVVIFVGLSAYDTQKIRRMGESMNVGEDDEQLKRLSVIGALTLYLDFINLFLMLLRFFGNRRN